MCNLWVEHLRIYVWVQNMCACDDKSTRLLQSSHGGGLASPVVAQEGGDMALVHVETQLVDSQLAVLVALGQVVHVDPQRQVCGLRLKVHL